MKVLVACEFSGTVRDAFAARGHDAWSCDILPTDKPGQHLQCDVREVLDRKWDIMIAHPPCTLWLKNLPLLQPTEVVVGREARVHKMPPSPDRWKKRSITYQGIAKAMSEQWG
jgi:hypothetical protein